mmetsp:Transcript_6996/g.9649  ORF Transcript_6996/g.9649 Transcript_6996/m.9649 type:complete len:306 (-) Transcript_6996:114-1031(-)
MAMNMSLNVNSYRRQQQESTLSPSERWKTTSETELKRVAEQLVGTYDMKGMKDRMTQRKLNNTKTSIHFGNEKVVYVSDTHDNQNRCQGGSSIEERATQMKRIKDMKAELTTTNFKLGDEPGQYETTNRLAMTETDLGSAKVPINVNLKEAVKKSSIHFGNEPVDYKSVAHDSMQYKGSVGNYTALKDEVKQMTNTLRKHNFSFGDEKVNYQSDYAAGYGDVDVGAYKKSDESKASMRFIIDDSRSCHFSLGNDKVNYLSNTQMALSSIEGRGVGDNLANIQGAKAIKTALQKTSIVIGDDEKYY